MSPTQSVMTAFFNRSFQESTGLYAFARVQGLEKKAEVARNQQAICQALGGTSLWVLDQVHGTDVMDGEAFSPGRDPEYQADAFITNQAGVLLGIQTADCVPVLIEGETREGKPLIAAIHAGWRGALAGIVSKVMHQLRGKGLQRSRASLGPAIHASHYQVPEAFRERFIVDAVWANSFFSPWAFQKSEEPPTWAFDLVGYVCQQLFHEQVDFVDLKACEDTYAFPEKYWSHRFATHTGIDRAKRSNLSVIGIR